MNSKSLKGMFKNLISIALFLFSFIFLSSMLNSGEKFFTLNSRVLDPPFLAYDSVGANSMLETMTLEQKIAQSFMVDAECYNYREDSLKFLNSLGETLPGGFLFSINNRFDKNIISQLQQRKGGATSIPFMIGGMPESLNILPKTRCREISPLMLGAIRDEELIFRLGSLTGKYLKELGVHMSFVQLADNKEIPDSLLLKYSYGDDNLNTIRKIYALSLGLQNNRILASINYHASSEVLHAKNADIERENPEKEIYPIQALINKGISALKINPISAADKRETSKQYRKLIDSLNFKGLRISNQLYNIDKLQLADSVKNERIGTAYQNNDILLVDKLSPSMLSAIVAGVESGKISEKFVDAKCKKILRAKTWAPNAV
ncbi:MAG: hypothetical protein CSA05_03455 [Bacteroidia bacterium]|nr:MAG: hypothetical protein CSA05_03455 [Bacteroidia bacterium]